MNSTEGERCEKTKEFKEMLEKRFVDQQEKEYTLTHIDAVPDNFLFVDDRIYLIDWEYSGMQDPHVDIAMFAIYALYEKEQIDRLIDAYFTEGCLEEDILLYSNLWFLME